MPLRWRLEGRCAASWITSGSVSATAVFCPAPDRAGDLNPLLQSDPRVLGTQLFGRGRSLLRNDLGLLTLGPCIPFFWFFRTLRESLGTHL